MYNDIWPLDGRFYKMGSFNHYEPENASIDKWFGVLARLKTLVYKTLKTVKLLLSKRFIVYHLAFS